MNEPTFIMIGAARCGTTSMARWLDAHPRVFMTKPKEVFFFSHHGNYNKGWEHYLKLYAAGADAAERGEATTDYANTEKYPWVAERIARHLPECRLIFMVRHPLQRIESQWELSRSLGATTLSLTEAVFAYPELIQMSNYLKTMDAYLEHFRREQIHIVFFEQFKSDPRRQVEACLDFLGVDVDKLPWEVERSPNRRETLRRRSPLLQELKRHAPTGLYRRLFPDGLRQRVHRLLTKEKTGTWNGTTEACSM